MTQRLEGLLNVLNGRRVFIQTHNFPDPDALSCAFGVQNLLRLFDIEACICYKGAIAKASTTKMVDLLGIEMKDIEEITDMDSDDYIITVDVQANNSNIAVTPGTIVACIDHHPTLSAYSYLFRDVRICGACATLVADYFFANDLPMDRKTATALLYGLKMDTEDFKRGVTELDIEMFKKLFDLADNDTIKHLMTQQMEFSDLGSYIDALANIKIFDGIAFSYINGAVSDGLIASVCDFMLTLVEVQFAIVYAPKGHGLKFSVRSGIDYLDAGTITTNALEGIGTGGGHAAMAGGYVPFEIFDDVDFDIEEELQNRFINAVYFCRTLQNVLTDPIINFLENDNDEAYDFESETST